MRFRDPSTVVPLLVGEAASEMVEEILRRDPAMLVWWATEVECTSGLELGGTGDRRCRARPHPLGPAQWHEIQAVLGVRRTARRLLRTYPLRAADALQLAAALITSEGKPASLEVVALDDRLIEAARREGLVVTADG